MSLGKLAVILIALGLASGGIAAAVIDQGNADPATVMPIELLDDGRKDEIAQTIGVEEDDDDEGDDTNDPPAGVNGAANDGDASAANPATAGAGVDDTTDDYRSVPVKSASAKLGDGDDTRGNDGTRGGATGDGDRTAGNDGTSGGDNTGDGDWTTGNDGTGGGDNTGGPAVGGGGTDTGGGGTT